MPLVSIDVCFFFSFLFDGRLVEDNANIINSQQRCENRERKRKQKAGAIGTYVFPCGNLTFGVYLEAQCNKIKRVHTQTYRNIHTALTHISTHSDRLGTFMKSDGSALIVSA